MAWREAKTDVSTLWTELVKRTLIEPNWTLTKLNRADEGKKEGVRLFLLQKKKKKGMTVYQALVDSILSLPLSLSLSLSLSLPDTHARMKENTKRWLVVGGCWTKSPPWGVEEGWMMDVWCDKNDDGLHQPHILPHGAERTRAHVMHSTLCMSKLSFLLLPLHKQIHFSRSRESHPLDECPKGKERKITQESNISHSPQTTLV